MPGIETGNLGQEAGVFFVKRNGSKDALFGLIRETLGALYLAFKLAGFSGFCSHFSFALTLFISFSAPLASSFQGPCLGVLRLLALYTPSLGVRFELPHELHLSLTSTRVPQSFQLNISLVKPFVSKSHLFLAFHVQVA